MTDKEKGILINGIISYLEIENKSKNKELVRQGRYSEQIPFNTSEIFFKLAFMDNDNFKKLVNKIL